MWLLRADADIGVVLHICFLGSVAIRLRLLTVTDCLPIVSYRIVDDRKPIVSYRLRVVDKVDV